MSYTFWKHGILCFFGDTIPINILNTLSNPEVRKLAQTIESYVFKII